MFAKKDVFPEVTLLNSRGWTEELIAEILIEPDMVQTFPRHAEQPATRYYLRSRVSEAEVIESVAAIVIPRAEEWAKNRAFKKEQSWRALQDAISNVEIHLKPMSSAGLKIAAIENYYARLAEDRRHAPEIMDANRLQIIYRKFAVGQVVDYDAINAALPRPLDNPKIYSMISSRIEEKVLEVYPDLKPEPLVTADV